MALIYKQDTIEIYTDELEDEYQFYDYENSFILKFSASAVDKIIICLQVMYDKYVINDRGFNDVNTYRVISNDARELNKVAIFHNNILIGKALDYAEIIQDVCIHLNTENITRAKIKDKNIGYIIKLYNEVVKTKGAKNEKSSSGKN